MKNVSFILPLLAALLFACSARKRQPPAILEEKKIDVSSIYKKRGGDLVEALYEELVRNSAGLRDLEQRIKTVKASIPDSLEAYRTYHEKNVHYYDAAEKKAMTISDSILRASILNTIQKSRTNYRDSIAALTTLDSLITQKSTSLTNLHELLKITATLPVIEDFQRTNRPEPVLSEELVRKMDELITQLDSLTRQIKPEMQVEPVEKQ